MRLLMMMTATLALAACADKAAEQESELPRASSQISAATAETAAPAEIDPCGLLSDEEVSRVLGKTVRGELAVTGAQCSWYAEGEDRAAFFVTIKDFREAPQFAERGFNRNNAPVLPGFGKSAYLEKPPLGSGVTLNVLLDGFVVHVGSSTSEDAAPLKELAPTVIENLG